MKAFISILVSLVSLNSYAAQSLNTKINGPYSSIRALGMGNAFTAVADDYSLIMYNPAGFARKKHNEIQVSLLGAGVSAKTLTIMDDINKASGTGTDSEKAVAVSAVLEKYYGQSLGGKVQALELFWVRNGWGVALLPLDLTIDMSINKQLGPALDLNVKGDTSIAIGFGKELTPQIDGGITLKYLHRLSIEEIIPAFELATDPNVLSEKRFREGTKADFDLGFMWRPNWFNSSAAAPPVPAKVEAITTPAAAPKDEIKDEKTEEIKEKKTVEKTEERKPQAEGDAKEVTPSVDEIKSTEELIVKVPAEPKAEEPKIEETSVPESKERYPLTIGFVVHNVIGGEFTLSKQINKAATEVPTKIHRVIDLGSQYLLRDGEDFKIRTMIDFQNILHPEITVNKSFHAGVEFDYSPSTWFKAQYRVGLNQMYVTAGASLLLAVVNIDIATYGEEVGSTNTKIENRVVAAKLGFNF